MKKGFTIVELLMVVAIIAILMGIVTTAAASSIKASRRQKANALCTIVQTALATYREQKGRWPIDMPVSRANREGANGNSNSDIVVLNGTEVRACVKALVEETKKHNPMMDISGLFVSRQDGELPGGASGASGGKGQNVQDQKIKPAYGLDFMAAIHGTRKSSKKMTTSEMYFGYPDPATGYFLRFKMTYSIPTDQLMVSQQR